MTDDNITASPLCWPAGWNRTPSSRRTYGQFGTKGQSKYGSWTDQDNTMNHAQLLKAAMPLLWDGVSPIGGTVLHICYAIAAASCVECGKISVAARDLQDEIERRIGYKTLYGWLVERVSLRMLTDERVQAHRLAWMQHLLEEAEQNGGWLLNTGPVSGKRNAAQSAAQGE